MGIRAHGTSTLRRAIRPASMSWMVLALGVVLCTPGVAHAVRGTVYVDYNITQDTVWSGNNDYVICYLEPVGGFTPNITPAVAPGVTLTIQPGARVLLAYSPPSINVNGTTYYPVSNFVVNGNIVASGATFTGLTINATQYAWDNIIVKPTAAGVPANGTFTGCTFERGGRTEAMLKGVESNATGVSTLNLAVDNCTFQDGAASVNQGAGISYGNGYWGSGAGTVSITGTTFQRLGMAILTDNNGNDPIDITVDDCSFTDLCKYAADAVAVNIRDGRDIVFTNNAFSNNGDGTSAHPAVVFGYDRNAGNWPTDIVFDGNTIDGGGAAVDYPVYFHASSRINADTPGATNTLTNFPADMRYAVVDNNVQVAGATWGVTGIDYVLPETVVVGQQELSSGPDRTESLAISPGTTIAMPDGVVLKVYTTLNAIGTAAKPITFRAKGAISNPTRIDISNLADSLALGYCVLDGLSQGVYGDLTPGQYNNYARPQALTIADCSFRNMVGSGMEIAARGGFSAGTAVVRDSVFENNGAHGYRGWAPYADRYSASALTFQRCVFRDNAGDGLYLDAARNTRLENCLVYGNGANGVTVSNNLDLPDGWNYDQNAPAIVGTTIARNAGFGVLSTRTAPVPESVAGPFVTNSILSGNTRGDLSVATGVDGVTTYSCVTVTSVPLGWECIKVDPLFADVAARDFHLKSATGRWNGAAWVTDTVTSPCINTGDPNYAMALEPAPNGSIINMGRYGNTAEASKKAGVAPPAAITGFHLDLAGHDALALTWNAATGAQGYQLFRATSEFGAYALVHSTAGTSRTDTGLSPGTYYYYRVRPYLASGGTTVYGGYSDVSWAGPMAAAPTGVAAAPAGPTSVRLTWNAVDGAAGYAVWKYTSDVWSSSQGMAYVGDTTGLTITDATAIPGVTWYYKVTAYCMNGDAKVGGLQSAYVAGTPGGVTPTLTRASVGTPVAPSRMTHSHKYTVYGYVSPQHTAGTTLVTLKFYKRNSHGTYVYHNSVSAKGAYYSATKSKYSAKLSLPHAGKWRVRAYHADAEHTASYSGYDYITVR